MKHILSIFLTFIPTILWAGGGYISVPPNASNISGTVGVANGGTGQTSFPANNILIGNGSGPINTISTFTVLNAGGVGIGVSNTGSNGTLVVQSTSTTPTNPVVNVLNNSGASLAVVNQNGRMGIGTLSPATELHVVTNTDGIYLSSGTDGAGQRIGRLSWGYATTQDFDIQAWTGHDLSLGATLGNHLIIKTSGNVGIGTTSPATKLHMSSGTLTIDGNVAPSITAIDAVGIGSFTTAQVQAKTPTAVGQLIFNSTLSQVCVSTGTTVEGYARVSNQGTCQ